MRPPLIVPRENMMLRVNQSHQCESVIVSWNLACPLLASEPEIELEAFVECCSRMRQNSILTYHQSRPWRWYSLDCADGKSP